jgi:hypothetical protein
LSPIAVYDDQINVLVTLKLVIMKTSFNFRNTVIAVITFFATALTTTVNATDDKNNTTVELKFIGNFRNKPVFELNIVNPGSDKEFVLNIRDEYGNSLYRETLKSNVLSKKFLLNTDEINLEEVLRFEITGKESKKTFVYEVNQNTRYVAETLVSKVD